MTPKEKAEELFYKMSYNSFDEDHHCSHYVARNCALIAVDEIIEQWEYLDIHIADLNAELNPNLKYWYEIKQEIEKL